MGACAPSGISNSTTLSVDPDLFTRLARRITRTCRVSYPSARGVSTVDFASIIEWAGILNNCEMQCLDDLVGATVRAVGDVLWQGTAMTAQTADEFGRQPPKTKAMHPPKVVHRLLANRLGTALIERKIVYALKAGILRSLNVDAATLRIVSYWLSLAPERITSTHPGWIAVKGLMRDHKINLSVAELLSGQREINKAQALRALPKPLKTVVRSRVCETVDSPTREAVCLEILSALCDAFEQLSRPAQTPTTDDIICCLVMHSLLQPSREVGTGKEDIAESEMLIDRNYSMVALKRSVVPQAK
ncbi:hypothetical protein Pmar_PMAR004029 [Perkinsus marinus ATCC 50983]|uniref:Uncharacterized protein n=1 Tax=Perkinsus marinus (strain ATCC 50983 / TXsc) TaxID=423536 RepID=C5M0I9_PERM5|nr:hypothetical protein Pmar_PMAR004029 [Perkinsus marinus ATCC 50983]EEQ97524.1 hypothetical protein Pmar_PMAR004029 [Perkinsus marinus ATCC 50983]|eukprot:XP_002764807.1 hypothetical protein Pmar_PMAR004029 [Perkinsus marinus ATCC 50983]